MTSKGKKHQLPQETKIQEEEEHWQLNPLECLDESTKCNQDHKKKKDDKKKDGKSGFDEWSVSWP